MPVSIGADQVCPSSCETVTWFVRYFPAPIANAQQIATRIQAEAREQAQRDREAALERATAEIQLERDRAIADLRGEFADITVQAAERVIGQSLDRQSHQRIIDEALAESNFGGN